MPTVAVTPTPRGAMATLHQGLSSGPALAPAQWTGPLDVCRVLR